MKLRPNAGFDPAHIVRREDDGAFEDHTVFEVVAGEIVKGIVFFDLGEHPVSVSARRNVTFQSRLKLILLTLHEVFGKGNIESHHVRLDDHGLDKKSPYTTETGLSLSVIRSGSGKREGSSKLRPDPSTARLSNIGASVSTHGSPRIKP